MCQKNLYFFLFYHKTIKRPSEKNFFYNRKKFGISKKTRKKRSKKINMFLSGLKSERSALSFVVPNSFFSKEKIFFWYFENVKKYFVDKSEAVDFDKFLFLKEICHSFTNFFDHFFFRQKYWTVFFMVDLKLRWQKIFLNDSFQVMNVIQNYR